MDHKELNLELRDEEWPLDYLDHERQIVRGIVADAEGYYHFVRVVRNDEFGNETLIETSGGGVESGEELTAALRRELREELGAEVEILCKLGVVRDAYNLLHRRNINHYYLCRALSFGARSLTEDEQKLYHLSRLKLRYPDALAEYTLRSESALGRLIARRELPVLRLAHEILSEG